MSGAEAEERVWRVRAPSRGSPDEVEHLVSTLQKATGLSPLALRVCVLRGYDTEDSIREFLLPKFENLKNPFSIRDMDRAVDRLAQAKAAGEKIRVFGDYDVDGTTGAALLGWIFRDFGFQWDIRQPDRFKDGYGLNVKAVEAASSDGIGVLLTVDCGITSFDAAKRAQELGLPLIVVDHHQLDPQKGLPPAVAVVNPQRKDCESGLKQLCGCGLAFYLAVALRARGRTEGWFEGRSEPNLKQHLDLVVMATAADMVPLTGDNHILVRYGLEVLKNSKKAGVRALLEAAGLSSKDFSPSHLGFVLGPRINASGRMQSASLALDLLITQDPQVAQQLAAELERLNLERAQVQNEIWDEVRLRVQEGLAQGRFRSGIVVADTKWHEGVVGIVASRVTELFRKPAVVIALREDLGKGSVRSYGGKDVLAALRESAPHLLGFGGHKHAAGLSLALDQVDAFANAFDQAVQKLPEDSQAACLWVEGACSLEDLNVKALEELERLGPFGPGNPEPVFTVRARAQDHRILKGRHLKLSLGSESRREAWTPGTRMDAIWFNGAEKSDVMEQLLREQQGDLELEQEILGSELGEGRSPGVSQRSGGREWAGVPELNRFRGQVTPTLRIRDWRRRELAE